MITGLKTTHALVHTIAALLICTALVSCKDNTGNVPDNAVPKTTAPVAERGPVEAVHDTDKAPDDDVPETAAPVAERGPVEVLQDYCQALKDGDTETADALIARSPKLPEKYITDYNVVFSRSYDKYMRVVIHPELLFVKGDCAAVLCDMGKEGGETRERAFLLRQEGEWKVLMRCWDRDLSWYPWEGQLEKDHAAVEAWSSENVPKKPWE